MKKRLYKVTRKLKGLVKEKAQPTSSVKESGAFGLWKDRTETRDPNEYVRTLRGRSA